MEKFGGKKLFWMTIPGKGELIAYAESALDANL
jgi:hypothetical protein